MQSAVNFKDPALSGLKVGEDLHSPPSPQKLQKILVPVDVPDHCRVSIDYAIRLAQPLGSSVNLLYLYHEPYALNNSPRSRNCDVFTYQRRKVFADFYDLLQETRDCYSNSIGYFEYGHGDHDICKIARQLHADLLIVSMHKDKWLMRIAANAPCPVLFVREQEDAGIE